MWANPQLPGNLVTLTEEILNGKLHFLCSVQFSRILWVDQVLRRSWGNRDLYLGPCQIPIIELFVELVKNLNC